MKQEHRVKEVEEGSIAWELGVEPGDVLLQINKHVIEDVFDYHYYVNDEELLVLIRKPNGEEWELEILYHNLTHIQIDFNYNFRAPIVAFTLFLTNI